MQGLQPTDGGVAALMCWRDSSPLAARDLRHEWRFCPPPELLVEKSAVHASAWPRQSRKDVDADDVLAVASSSIQTPVQVTNSATAMLHHAREHATRSACGGFALGIQVWTGPVVYAIRWRLPNKSSAWLHLVRVSLLGASPGRK